MRDSGAVINFGRVFRKPRRTSVRHTLFVYGTLLFPEIMRRVIGRVLPNEPATLRGYTRRRIEGELYPGIVPRPGDAVEGRLCRGIDGATLAQLDEYEGGQFERRLLTVVTARGKRGAFVYVLAPAHRASATGDWSPETFLRDAFTRYLDEDAAVPAPADVRDAIIRTRNG